MTAAQPASETPRRRSSSPAAAGRRAGAIPRPGRRSQKTRAGLVKAAREILEEQGVAALTVKAVTDRADVAHGTFYHHFPSTEDVLAAAIEDSMREFAEGMVADFADSDDKAWVVVGSLSRAFRMLAGHAAIGWMLERPRVLASAMRDAFGPFSRRDLAAMVEAGELEAAVLARAGRWWEWTVVGALTDAVADPQAGRRIELALVDLVLRALEQPPRRIEQLLARVAREQTRASRATGETKE